MTRTLIPTLIIAGLLGLNACGSLPAQPLDRALMGDAEVAKIQPAPDAMGALGCRATGRQHWAPGEVYPSDSIEDYVDHNRGAWAGRTADGGYAISSCR